MPSRKRCKNVQHVRPIIFGSRARLLGPEEQVQDRAHTHRWWIYVRGLDGYDISTFIRKVTFKLHESFENPLRVVNSPPFQVEETGWGDFEVVIKVYVKDPYESPIQLYHMLQLYPYDPNFPKDQDNVSEHYDELIFNEPTTFMHDILVKNPYPPNSLENKPSEFPTDKLAMYIAKLDSACKKLQEECEEQKRIIEELKAKSESNVPLPKYF